MGFIRDIQAIVAKLPKERQTLFFSATMPQAIAELADQMLRDPAKVAVTPVATTADKVAQRVIRVDRGAKASLLAKTIRNESIDRVIVFTRTKHGADKVARGLVKDGIPADAIHGNKSQNYRERVLAAFRDGSLRTLVATDIAARGIDVDGVSHVINFDMPFEPESYVHRIGRTARAGAEGSAISFVSADEASLLRAIERLIRMQIPASGETTEVATAPAARPQGRPQHRPEQGQPRPSGHKHRPRGQKQSSRGRQNGNSGASRPAPSHDASSGEPTGLAAVEFMRKKPEQRNNRGARQARPAR